MKEPSLEFGQGFGWWLTLVIVDASSILAVSACRIIRQDSPNER